MKQHRLWIRFKFIVLRSWLFLEFINQDTTSVNAIDSGIEG